ncbi:amidohydrolase [Jongsikchunia kroppenstedtii]|uniref:amidohydrolase n=1 Tax=Jongsikchunia kroppenstedtii TaxID=1121721 RepID=UPI000363509B|nr:amidohydrolase [Jongsikchunia kroppenstedtii]
MIAEAVAAVATDLTGLSASIHAEPELAFEEHRSAAKTSELLGGYGFEVRRGVAGLPTAFDARFGSGDLVVTLCAEYDALPGLGHACGHNIIAAAAVGAARALSTVADELGITVQVLGTPAEEAGGGKITLLDAGAFDEAALAMMVHPADVDEIRCRSLALADIAVAYRGVEAHASAAPERGRNAADAATVAQVAVGLLRQHLEPGQQIHGMVTVGGSAPNVIAAHTELMYYLRALDGESLQRLDDRAEGCFAAGAVATGCTHECRIVSPTYLELRHDDRLAEAYRTAIIERGRRPAPPGREGLRPFGSTDMGNVSQTVPSIHPLIGIDSGGANIHEPGFAAAAVSPSADQAIIDGAIALAETAAAVAVDQGWRAELLQLREKRSQ